MKRILACSLYLTSFVTLVGCAAVAGRTEARDAQYVSEAPVSVSFFYDSLSPYGQWFQDASFGWCWTPYDVSADWRPYLDGHWEYTDSGWGWVSNEPWGWATYHYGRWLFDDSYGWVWVPGTEWAPAWVAWRSGDDCIGWAPLPPQADWNDSGGLSFSDVNSIPSYEWCFVPQRHVLDVKLRAQVTVVARNVTLFERSHDATRYEVRNGRPANVGPGVNRIEKAVGRRVSPVKIVDTDTPRNGRGQSVGHGAVGFFRPRMQSVSSGAPPSPHLRQDRTSIPNNVMQRRSEEQQRRLESDLKAERARLERDQRDEMRAQRGPGIEEIRRRQAAEQQAFQAHAALQRKVLQQRMQRQVVRPDKSQVASKQNGRSRGRSR